MILLNIAGGVSLLLLGLTMLRLGMTRGFGASLRQFIARSTRSRIKAFASGAFVTMLLQSSTATILIVTSFAAQDLISTSAALAVILGADVGTTIVAQLLSFDISWLAPLLIISGYILYRRERSSKLKNIGRILVGLAFMFIALGWIRESAEPLKHSATLPLILKPLANDAILAVGVSAIITWVLHSSLAFVLLLVSLVGSSVLPLELGLVMVLGANVGGTVAPMLAALKDTPAAKRIPVGNIIMRLTGVVLVLPFIDLAQPALESFGIDPGRQIVTFHMLFNLALALLFLPLAGIVAAACKKIVPDRLDNDDPGQPKYLDKNALDTPSIALASAVRETLRMADMIEVMLSDSIRAFKANDEEKVSSVTEQDDIIDNLYTAIKNYLARLNEEFMDASEAQRYLQIFTFATNIEHAGDIIDKNLMASALKKIRKNQKFSSKGLQEIEDIHAMVMDTVRLSQSVFVSEDKELAKRLLKQKDYLRNAEAKASVSHIERLREGIPETFATSSLHIDIIRDLRRINTHLCNIAYPVLETPEEIKGKGKDQQEVTLGVETD